MTASPTTTEPCKLSPAAQAVWEAYQDELFNVTPGRPVGAPLAAVLRALADHSPPPWNGTGPLCHWYPDRKTRHELRVLAHELESFIP